ncbi:MAG TPA: serine/threonine-protein kinase [Candidatus Acidoferrales bacterium]|nr:serine/threonine-protein kinase [Candidatus Acidoferrales bacterium]
MQLGRYEILEPIGLGASSTVFKARDTLIGRTVAIKTLHSGLTDPAWRERFMAEARIVGQLSHPRIVKLHDMGIDESSGAPYLVMEYVLGETLEKYVALKKVEAQQVYTWGAALARALAYAHEQGIVHGDVKPANVMINQDGRVMLTDFGIARFAAHISHAGSLRGTPAYLSPEQIEGNPTDGRSDLFSLGIVLYHLATGERPFRGESMEAVCAQILKAKIVPPTRVNPALPRAFDDVIDRCLVRNPAQRYANGELLSTDLEALTRNPVSDGHQKPRARKLKSSLLGYAAAPILLIVGLAGTLAGGFYRHNLRIPTVPVATYPTPRAPADLPLWRESKEVTGADETAAIAESEPPRTVRPPKAVRNTKKVQATPESKPTTAESVTSTVPVAAPESAELPSAPTRVAGVPMTIEVSAQSGDGTVAVFADHELVFSTPLSTVAGQAGEPLRTVCKLTPGQHDLSVALYKTDNSLRSQKGALADLEQGEPNVLAIRVVKHAKILLLRGTGLEVTWPAGSVDHKSEHGPKDFSAKITDGAE